MKRNNFLLILLSILSGSCSTQAYLIKPGSLAGKRIALGNIDITRMQKKRMIQNDTVCACIKQTVGEKLYPYLQKAGAIIVDLTNEQRTNETRINQAIDSLQVDYVLSGTGFVQRTGSSDFMEQLTLKVIAVKTKEVIATGSFGGPSVTPGGAADRIGKKMLKQNMK
jgi:hypothetical protein